MDKFINVKPLDILFIKSNHIGGKIIRWWTNSQIDHVELCLGNEKTIGSRPKGGVQIHDFSICNNSGWVILRPTININNEQKNKIIEFAKSQIDKKYDWLGILGFVLNSHVNDPKEYFCSEFVSECFVHGDIKLIPRKASSFITPELLFQSLALTPIASNYYSSIVDKLTI